MQRSGREEAGFWLPAGEIFSLNRLGAAAAGSSAFETCRNGACGKRSKGDRGEGGGEHSWLIVDLRHGEDCTTGKTRLTYPAGREESGHQVVCGSLGTARAKGCRSSTGPANEDLAVLELGVGGRQ